MNSFTPINPALIDVPSPEIAKTLDSHPGYPEHLAAEDREPGVLSDCCGAASRAFPKELWIEPREWEERARQNDEYNTWPINYVDRFTNQDPTHECTTHSFGVGFSAARNRQRGIIFPEGPKKGFRYEESRLSSVFVSPLSIYIEANPRQWGGANVRQVMEIGCRRGFLPDKIQPREYDFKHTLHGTTGRGNSNQSSGPWVSLSRLPDGWEETAKLFRPLEVIFPGSFEEAICLLLHGYVVCVGRNGHAVPWAEINFTSKAIPYVDSYDVIRYDSFATARSAWQGSFAVASVTTPDDWAKPGE